MKRLVKGAGLGAVTSFSFLQAADSGSRSFIIDAVSFYYHKARVFSESPNAKSARARSRYAQGTAVRAGRGTAVRLLRARPVDDARAGREPRVPLAVALETAARAAGAPPPLGPQRPARAPPGCNAVTPGGAVHRTRDDGIARSQVSLPAGVRPARR